MVKNKGRLLAIGGIASGIGALVVASLYPSEGLPIAFLSGISGLLLLWFTRVHLSDIRRIAGKRATWIKLNAVLAVILVGFIVVMINLVFRQYYFRYDLSTTGQFSLSERSKRIASLVEKDLKIVFLGQEQTEEFKRARQLLEGFRYLNRRILYSLHDLDRSPDLAGRYNVREYNTFVADNGKRYFKVRGVSEENIANLIVQATRKEQKRILFLKGHDERTDSFTDRGGYGKAISSLRKLGYDVKVGELSALDNEIDLLIIASPVEPFKKEELDKIKDYLNRGGKVLLFLDLPEKVKELQGLFSITLGDYLIHDPHHDPSLGPTAPFLDDYMNERVFKGRVYRVMMPTVREIRFLYDAEFRYESIARVSSDSWKDVNGNHKLDKEDETTGLEDVTSLIEQKEGLMKAVVLSDGDFASNAYIDLYENNAFFTGLVNWLTGEGTLVDIPPPEPVFVPMYVTPEQLRLVRLIGPVGLPALFVLSGLLVFLWRRRL